MMSPRKQKQKSHGSGRGICSADWYTLASKMQDPSSIMIAPSVVVDSESSVTGVGVVTSSRGSSGSPVVVAPGVVPSGVVTSGVVTSGVAVLSGAGFVGSVAAAPAVAAVSAGFSVSTSGFAVVALGGSEGIVAFTSGASVVDALPVKNSITVVKIDGDSVVAGGVAFLPSTGSTVVAAGVTSSSRGTSGSADVSAVDASVVVA